MGRTLIKFYRSKVKNQWKWAFVSTFLIGLLIHFYKFTNTLLNRDSLYNFYSDQNVIGSGRWFLSIACGFSSYFDLPWVNGILSLALVSATVVIIVELFRIENPVLIVIIGGLTVSFPSMTETLFFEFTADGYMLAMLFSALTVYCSAFERRKFGWNILSVIFICLSCGIYQAFVSFALVLTLFYFVNELLENRHTDKMYRNYIIKQVCIYIAGLVLYYIIWQICMAVQGVGANDYQGISDISNPAGFNISLSSFILGLKYCIVSILFFFFEWNVLENSFNLYGVLNIIFIVVFLAGLFLAFIKSGLLHRKKHLVLALLALALCVPSIEIWLFVSENVGYRPMMLYSICVIYIYSAILFNRWFDEKISNIPAILLAIIIFNNGLIANISYYYLDKCYKQSYATGLEMTMRIHDIEGKVDFDKIAIIGDRVEEVRLLGSEGESAHIHIMTRLIESNLLYDREHTERFLSNTFDIDFTFASEDECYELSTQKEVIDMESWPSTESMKVVDGVLVVKIGDIPENDEVK